MKATATAHPNLALVKYWGKRDEALILPHQSSLSLTLAPLSVSATVEFGVPADDVVINGKKAQGSELSRVLVVFDHLRRQVGRELGPVRMHSEGNFPMAAGLASSAAAFAAIAVAARAAAGLARDTRSESVLARLGSGSACRSVLGGLVAWRRGEKADGSDSFAEQVAAPSHWPELRMVVAVLHREEKEVKSRDGMRHTVETSPYYPAWVKDAAEEVARAEELIRRRDLEGLGELAERNAWRMHATAFAANPPLCYLKPKTLEVIQRLPQARRDGLPVWFTLDAGPNPVLLTDAANAARVEALARECGAQDVVTCVPGGDARVETQAP
jgi:diphosphomevalonate decarboxylase